jgi:hypothetical protein
MRSSPSATRTWRARFWAPRGRGWWRWWGWRMWTASRRRYCARLGGATRGRGCAREVHLPEGDCCGARDHSRRRLSSRRGGDLAGSRAHHAPCGRAAVALPRGCGEHTGNSPVPSPGQCLGMSGHSEQSPKFAKVGPPRARVESAKVPRRPLMSTSPPNRVSLRQRPREALLLANMNHVHIVDSRFNF